MVSGSWGFLEGRRLRRQITSGNQRATWEATAAGGANVAFALGSAAFAALQRSSTIDSTIEAVSRWCRRLALDAAVPVDVRYAGSSATISGDRSEAGIQEADSTGFAGSRPAEFPVGFPVAELVFLPVAGAAEGL